MTLAVLTIMTMAAVPLVQLSVKRQREQQLRESLREMRLAIEQFHRDTMNCPNLNQQPGTLGGQINPQNPQQAQAAPDPRSRVCINDATIFGMDNPDRYPPDLDTLVNGVSIIPRQQGPIIGGPSGPNATDNTLTALKKKIYLRAIPVDPVTGKAEWDLRSSYDGPDTNGWGGENVFDVRSKSTATALNGEKYSDW